MKLALIVTLASTSLAFCMELDETPQTVSTWAHTIVDCFEQGNTTKLHQLMSHPPILRTEYPLNQKIREEIKTHRDDQMHALLSPCSPKKVWNKCRALVIDLGLPITALGIGLADGIISGNKAILILTSVYFGLSLEGALKQAYAHWTMKNYQDKVEQFDVLLELLEGMQKLQNKEGVPNSLPLIPSHDEN